MIQYPSPFFLNDNLRHIFFDLSSSLTTCHDAAALSSSWVGTSVPTTWTIKIVLGASFALRDALGLEDGLADGLALGELVGVLGPSDGALVDGLVDGLALGSLVGASVGNVAACRLLVDAGADVHRLDRRGKKPVQLAAAEGKVGAVDFLMGIAHPEYALELAEKERKRRKKKKFW